MQRIQAIEYVVKMLEEMCMSTGVMKKEQLEKMRANLEDKWRIE